MRQFNPIVVALASLFVLLSASQQAFAGREGRSEMNFLLPYALSNKIQFDYGSSVSLEEDLGVGFSYAYNWDDHWAWRVDMTWNSSNYTASRRIDSYSIGFRGDLDVMSLLIGVDYNFAEGPVSPYVSMNTGWTYIDSNAGSLPSASDCWGEPWIGQACPDRTSADYSEKNMIAALGLGFRFEFARRNFFRIGYYYQLIDFDDASDMEGLETARFDFGFLY